VEIGVFSRLSTIHSFPTPPEFGRRIGMNRAFTTNGQPGQQMLQEQSIGAAMNQSKETEKPRSSFAVRLFRSGCVGIVMIALGRWLGFC